MEAEAILERLEGLETRCPKLGHQVAFGYCRREHAGLPCPRSLGCWRLRFPVELVLRHTLSESDFERIFVTPPKTRVDCLIEAIDRATTPEP